MPNRTIQFMGQAYSSNPGASPVTITAVLDGNTIFNGTVTTLQDPGTPWPPAEQYVLFQVETDQLPTSFSGSLPMTCSVSGGGVNWCLINTNYYIGNVAQDPNAGTVGNFSVCNNTGDSRSNVAIDGVVQVPTYTYGPTYGIWLWPTVSGQVLSYSLNVDVGQVGPTPPPP